MRKILCAMLCMVMLLSGCGETKSVKEEIKREGEYIKGMWFSYSEIDRLLNSGDFKAQFEIAADNCQSIGITDAFIHVRAFGDSLYPSQFFPQKENAAKLGFDVFEYITATLKQRNIRVHGWINPYRLRTADSDIEKLSHNSPAYIWLTNDDKADDQNVCLEGGIYLNPASVEVQRLCLDSARELLDNYEIAGIHIDDYFYPTTSASFDNDSYMKYVTENSGAVSMPHHEWRRANVNALVSGYYSLVKAKNEDIIFSISPAADIDKNLNEYYADVKLWADGGYADWIIPQLYFGFEYPQKKFRFDNLLKEWKRLNSDRKVKLMIGLASYKIGTTAQPDAEEWINGDDIIARQEQICFDDPLLNGHVYFSYSSVF